MLPRKAPVPVHAKVDAVTGLVTVRFNQELRTGASDAGNWSGRTYSDPFDHLFAQATAPPLILGTAVTFTPTLGAIDGGPLQVSYAASPPDLVGRCSLVPVAPFVDFPMSGPPSFPQFVNGIWDVPTQRWVLFFSEPITVQPPAFDPRVWRVKQGPLRKFASTVQLQGGRVLLGGLLFNGLEDTLIYQGGPPDWTDAEGDPIQAFTHALPS